MGYTLPTFNVLCNIWRGPGHVGAPALSPVCQLGYPGRGPFQVIPGTLPTGQIPWFLRLPARTDIRDAGVVGGGDTVECPAGTGRFYRVQWADDVARGFTNEYRLAFIYKIYPWPLPFP